MLRLLESAGVGLLGGCGVGLILVPVLLYRGQAALLLALASLGLGILAGLAWALLHRPQALDAAAEADRQLHLADLLSTAWLLRNHPPTVDPFAAAVLASANARCAGLAPSAILFNRLGKRAWSGIGLTAALVLTLGLISSNPIDSLAVASQRQALLKPTATPPAPPAQAFPNPAGARTRSEAIASDYPGAKNETPLDPTQATAGAAKNPSSSDSTQMASDPTGTGLGSGRSEASRSADPLRAAGTDRARTGGQAAASGTGAPGAPRSAPRGASGQSAGHPAATPTAPLWSAQTWPAAQEAADAALRANTIPPAYHELIRDYFNR